MEELQIEGDYSDVLTYLANLFSIKRIEGVDIDRFRVSYSGCDVIRDASTGSSEHITHMPERDDVDRIKLLSLNVDGIGDSRIQVNIGWDSVVFIGNPDGEIARYFLEVLDKSTFRYF